MPPPSQSNEAEPRRWRLLVCPCGTLAQADVACAGFPGQWDEDRSDFDRGACLGEIVEVVEVIPVGS